MDTRFWGPSGWKLLHLVTFDYQYSTKNAMIYAAFFETIPYILPCKFCRSSLTDYYKQHPYTHSKLTNGYMSPTLNVKKWMYIIHKCVNTKLKKQGLSVSITPPFSEVTKQYTTLLQAPWTEQLALCWDFLFAVAYHYPTYVTPDPMPDAPPLEECKTSSCEMNKWNVLPVKERMKWFIRFWSLLPDILPSEIQQKWKKVGIKPDLRSRATTLAWLWKMRCALDTTFKDPYTSVCNYVKSYSSDCKHSHTCRKKQTRKKK